MSAIPACDCLDVLIVGAGLSGIGAAYYLQREHPAKSWAILEARAAIGGTWDLFRYPGVRSDSDLHTFGYAFKPWVHEQSIAGGQDILAYLRAYLRYFRPGFHPWQVAQAPWYGLWRETFNRTGDPIEAGRAVAAAFRRAK